MDFRLQREADANIVNRLLRPYIHTYARVFDLYQISTYANFRRVLIFVAE